MNLLLIFSVFLVYIIVGSILMEYLERKDYLELQPMGYYIFPLIWIFVLLAITPYILIKLISRRNK